MTSNKTLTEEWQINRSQWFQLKWLQDVQMSHAKEKIK